MFDTFFPLGLSKVARFSYLYASPLSPSPTPPLLFYAGLSQDCHSTFSLRRRYANISPAGRWY
jgi:hypothetical protein